MAVWVARAVMLALVALAARDALALSPAPRWQHARSGPVRVLFLPGHEGLAQRVARAARKHLQAQLQRFAEPHETPSWTGRVDIYLYPSQRDLMRMTGGRWQAGSASSRPSRLYQGKILSRRVNLSARDPALLPSTLPHEITHIVVNELMSGEVPLWANEGLAVLAEPQATHRRYDALVAAHAADGALFPLPSLMALKTYPADPDKPLFYGQSMSLTRYLLGRGSARDFLLFLQMTQLYDVERALWAVYEIKGTAQLTERWLQSLQPPKRHRQRRRPAPS